MIKNKKERYCNFLKEKGYSTHTISAYPRALEKFGKAIGDNIFTMIIPDDIESIEEKLSDKEYSMVNDNNGDIHAALMQYVKFLEEKEYDEDGLYIDFDDLNRVERLQFLDSNDANEINNVTELEKRGFKYVCSFSELVNEPANHKKIMKKWTNTGIYALVDEEENKMLYIGRTAKSLKERIGNYLWQLSPVGGTNIKIHDFAKKYKNNIDLYFFQQKDLERELIKEFNPLLNWALKDKKK